MHTKMICFLLACPLPHLYFSLTGERGKISNFAEKCLNVFHLRLQHSHSTYIIMVYVAECGHHQRQYDAVDQSPPQNSQSIPCFGRATAGVLTPFIVSSYGTRYVMSSNQKYLGVPIASCVSLLAHVVLWFVHRHLSLGVIHN